MDACAAAAAAGRAGGAGAADDERPRRLLAADPRHMLSYVHPDNFEGLAVAAEVIALEEGKKKYTDSLHYTASILNSHVIGDSHSLCVYRPLRCVVSTSHIQTSLDMDDLFSPRR